MQLHMYVRIHTYCILYIISYIYIRNCMYTYIEIVYMCNIFHFIYFISVSVHVCALRICVHSLRHNVAASHGRAQLPFQKSTFNISARRPLPLSSLSHASWQTKVQKHSSASILHSSRFTKRMLDLKRCTDVLHTSPYFICHSYVICHDTPCRIA